MKLPFEKFLVSSLLLVVSIAGMAQNILLPAEHTERVIQDVLYLEDSTSAFTPKEVMSSNMEGTFLTTTAENTGYKKGVKTYWLKFKVINTDELDNDWVFNFDNWSFVDVYTQSNTGEIREYKTGHLLPFNQRDYAVGNMNLILLPVKSHDTLTCFARLHSLPDHTIMPKDLSFKVGQRSYVDAQNSRVKQIILLLLGAMMVMFIYNLFIYWSTRSLSYAYYLIIVGFTMYMTLSNSGYAVEIFSFIPTFPKWRGLLESIGSATVAVMMILFTMRILQTRVNFKFWHKVMKGFIWATVILTIGSVISFEGFGPLIFLVTFLLMAVFITVGILGVLKKIPSSGFYLLAYSFSVAGVIVLILMFTGAIPTTNFSKHYAMPLGYSLEMVFYSLALANMINVLKRENELNQEKIIIQLKENEQLQTKVNRELETKVEERTIEIRKQSEIIEKEKEKSDELLLNILPESIAEELKISGKASTNSFENVSVMFTDFKDFTDICEHMDPKELVANLDMCFRNFDDIAVKHNLEKIKTIGDSYMCAEGIPDASQSNPVNIVEAGLEMQEFIKSWNEVKKGRGEREWPMRIGIHTGPITAGVVGKKKFSYDIWGDTVNNASRMESSGEPGMVNISESTMELVKDQFNFIPRGKVVAKNKGMVDMYFVERLKKS